VAGMRPLLKQVYKLDYNIFKKQSKVK
jgi:hypothetical protein